MERTVTLIQRMGVELFDDVWHIRAESFYKNPYESHRPGYETWHHDTYLIPFSNVVAGLDDADSLKENELLKELKCHSEFEYSEYLPLGYLSFYVPIWYKDEKIREQLCDKFGHYLKFVRPDAVIIEDYAKGLFSPAYAQRIVDLCSAENIPVTLDPNARNPLNLHHLTIMKPNRAEAYEIAGIPLPVTGNSLDSLKTVAEKIRREWQVKYLLISLAEDGMALFMDDGTCDVIPTRAKEVFDVSGAGDTVIAACTLALSVKDDPILAAEIANYAAGVVVGKLGTATVSAEELKKALHLA